MSGGRGYAILAAQAREAERAAEERERDGTAGHVQGHRRRSRRHGGDDRDPPPAAQLLRHRADQADRGCLRGARQERGLPRHRARCAGHGVLRRRQARRRARHPGHAGEALGDGAGGASLHRGGAALPHGEADRGRDPRRGGRRRPGPRHGARHPRHLRGGALLRQLHAGSASTRASASRTRCRR